MDVLSIGETMVVFSPEEEGPMRYASNYRARVAGAETNTLIGLARLGHMTGWISKLGDDEFGHKIQSFVRGEGVDVSQVKLSEKAETGIFFKEKVKDDLTRVHYYRKGSAASLMDMSDINMGYVEQFNYLYVTGITPALSESCRSMIITLMEKAKQAGIIIIFDPNLRKKLWEEQVARDTLLRMISLSDIVLPGITEGAFLFEEEDEVLIAQKILSLGAKKVVVKLGEKGAYYQSETESGYAHAVKTVIVKDPVGAGDGFAAGFISGLLHSQSLSVAVEQACNVGAMVTTVNGDVEGLPNKKELKEFMNQEKQTDVIR
ncbi:2-dehydro-3-deoxygluconokinase [Bacillus sp. SA1-12]|uniref:sugar kinase n=1 Tax=Bacillus sp. SA1-12 TaxID=1455638 RepID=UPI0006252E61|nr:sugar kinase [Bacillus sp. SA1-12]KKI92779.1 2-dehydro-3-deoxygluconokinase [Bacillus sp. SA1-12]